MVDQGSERGGLALVGLGATYARGLAAALAEGGFAVEQPADIQEWLTDQPHGPFVVARVSPESITITGLRSIRPDARVVGLLMDPSPRDYAEALREGASGVADLESPTDHVVAVITSAHRHDVLLPAHIALWLSAHAPPESHVPITADEARWLSMLSRGARIQDVADEAGYSARHMSRLLKKLFFRMGAHNRAEAIALASGRGYLEETREPPGARSRE